MTNSRIASGTARALPAIVLLLAAGVVFAAGQTVRPAQDSNSRLEIKDAIVRGDETTVLFWTWPDRGDPGFSKECSKNYYTVALSPGLLAVEPQLMARGACAGVGLLHGGLLQDGSGKFVVRDRLEHWRQGELLSSEPFAAMEGVRNLGINSGEMGGQFVDFSLAGDMVVAIIGGAHTVFEGPDTRLVIASLSPDNKKRWRLEIEESDTPINAEQIWAGSDGSALMRYSSLDMKTVAASPETRLMHVNARGERSELPLMNKPKPFDIMSIRPGSDEDLQQFYAYQRQNRDTAESIKSLNARARDDGGFDVLFRRETGTEDRNGYFLLRLGSNGKIESSHSLGTAIDDHGLERWQDFYVTGNQLVLLSRALVTQQGVHSKRKQWPQTVVSRIDLESGDVASRLIPLDRQFLEAAMNAGDEGQQYLKGKPGGTPVLLTTLGGVPLSLSQGWIKQRNTLRIFEATDDLVAFTEYRDRHLAQLAKRERRQSEKASRQASKAKMASDLAAASGVSEKEFAALSKEEQAILMMQGGNMDAVLASAMQQAQAMAQGGAMTPEQLAQMNASMAQAQQMMRGAAMSTTGTAASRQQPVKPKAKPAFTVDALMRAHIRYASPDGTAATLFIVNRNNGEELLKKDYPNGDIDEYVSLGRYQLPPDQIGALVKGDDGQLLVDLGVGSASAGVAPGN